MRDSVIVHGEEVFVRKLHGKERLILDELEIKDIDKIEGLSELIHLQSLDLSYNQIQKIKGLDRLMNLQELDLRNNQIQEINGLDNLINLKELNLIDNQIRRIKGLDRLKNLCLFNLRYNPIYLNESELFNFVCLESIEVLGINDYFPYLPVEIWLPKLSVR